MKRGFTLVEIVGVIIILGIVVILAFPPLLKLVKSTESELDDATKNLVYTAAGQYINKYDYEKTNANVYCITFEDLVKENFLTKNNLDLNEYVKVEVSDNKFNYSITSECTESTINNEN